MAGRFLVGCVVPAALFLISFVSPTAIAQIKITVGHAAISPRLRPANIPMLNQGVVVTQGYLQKRQEVAEKVLMALVESLAFSLSPLNKPLVIKSMMRRFQITDPAVAEEGYRDYLTSVERKPYPSVEAMRNIQRLMAAHNPKVASVKIEDLLELRFVRKLDESGFIEKVSATYGFK